MSRVRRARPADLAVLPEIEVRAGAVFAEIGLTSIADDPPPSEAELRVHLDAGQVWVAEDDDGRVVGYATASVVDGEGHLDQVSVLPRARGKGLGAALVDEVCAWAREAGFDAVTLTTFTEVAWNGPLYRHLGFVDLDETSLGPQLRAIREAERAAGLDVRPRSAMRRELVEREGNPGG